MNKTAKKLAGILLAAAVAVAFMPAAGLLTGVDTAKALSEYKAIVSMDKQSIELDITAPYADVTPKGVGSYEKVVHEVDETTITVNDEWTDENGDPVTGPLEKGERYTYTATMISRTKHGDSAPDITKYNLSVKIGTTGEDVVWPGVTETPEPEKTGGVKTSKIFYTVTFTATTAPSRDKGDFKIDLKSGKQRVSDLTANTSAENLFDYYCTCDFTSADYDMRVDLDGDDIFDIGVNIGPGYEYYDYVKLPGASLKTQVTLDMPDSKRENFDKAPRDYYGAMTFVLGKYANPLSVKAKSKTLPVKYKKLRKKAQVIKGSKVLSFKNKGKGKITVQRYTVKRISKKGTKSSKAKKYFVIGSKTGKLTVKKGLKKGTYKVTVRVKAAGNADYKASAWKKVAFNVKVK